MKKKLKLVGNIIVYAFVAIIIAVFIMYFMGIKPYITMSGSMEPNIRTGSVCFVNTRADYNDIKEGDVVAFQTATGSLVTHRAIAVTDKGIETKGDNNEVSDGITTTVANFKGKTLFSVPHLGYLMNYLQQPTGKIIVAVIVIAIIALNIADIFCAQHQITETVQNITKND